MREKGIVDAGLAELMPPGTSRDCPLRLLCLCHASNLFAKSATPVPCGLKLCGATAAVFVKCVSACIPSQLVLCAARPISSRLITVTPTPAPLCPPKTPAGPFSIPAPSPFTPTHPSIALALHTRSTCCVLSIHFESTRSALRYSSNSAPGPAFTYYADTSASATCTRICIVSILSDYAWERRLRR